MEVTITTNSLLQHQLKLHFLDLATTTSIHSLLQLLLKLHFLVQASMISTSSLKMPKSLFKLACSDLETTTITDSLHQKSLMLKTLLKRAFSDLATTTTIDSLHQHQHQPHWVETMTITPSLLKLQLNKMMVWTESAITIIMSIPQNHKRSQDLGDIHIQPDHSS